MHSPVGMPGRAIRNPFLTEREQEREKSHTATSASKNATKSPFPTVLPQPWPALPMAIPTTLFFSAGKTHGVSIT